MNDRLRAILVREGLMRFDLRDLNLDEESLADPVHASASMPSGRDGVDNVESTSTARVFH